MVGIDSIWIMTAKGKDTRQWQAPGTFALKCGMDLDAEQDGIFLNAENGDIDIIASNGKIRMVADDIELVAVGALDQGNIKLEC